MIISNLRHGEARYNHRHRQKDKFKDRANIDVYVSYGYPKVGSILGPDNTIGPFVASDVNNILLCHLT